MNKSTYKLLITILLFSISINVVSILRPAFAQEVEEEINIIPTITGIEFVKATIVDNLPNNSNQKDKDKDDENKAPTPTLTSTPLPTVTSNPVTPTPINTPTPTPIITILPSPSLPISITPTPTDITPSISPTIVPTVTVVPSLTIIPTLDITPTSTTTPSPSITDVPREPGIGGPITSTTPSPTATPTTINNTENETITTPPPALENAGERIAESTNQAGTTVGQFISSPIRRIQQISNQIVNPQQNENKTPAQEVITEMFNINALKLFNNQSRLSINPYQFDSLTPETTKNIMLFVTILAVAGIALLLSIHRRIFSLLPRLKR